MNYKTKEQSSPDFFLFLLTLILVTVGLIMVYSASAILAHDRYGNSYYFFMRQLIWILTGSFGMWAASRVDLGQGRVYLTLAGKGNPSAQRLSEAVAEAGFTLVKVENR